MMAKVRRSDERIVFHYKTLDTPTSVRRKTLKIAAATLGMDETGFLHLAAAQMIERLHPRAKKSGADGDDGRLTDAQIAAIRVAEPQDLVPTRSFLQLLGK